MYPNGWTMLAFGHSTADNRHAGAVELARFQESCRVGASRPGDFHCRQADIAADNQHHGSHILSRLSEPGFVKVAEIFLIPSSFLVAALGTVDTNPHRALVSILGLIISLLWWTCSVEAVAELDDQSKRTRRARVLAFLPILFASGWLVSTICHVLLWNRPLGNS